jgi:hypothetical protein
MQNSGVLVANLVVNEDVGYHQKGVTVRDTHMLHGTGIFANIFPKNHPVL